jgi:hypothetical protein
MNKPKFPISVKRGSTVVKIYETPNKGFDSYTLSYWSDGKRKRKTFANLIEAKQEANRIAAIITRGSDQDVLKLTSKDRAAYLRARQLLDPLGIPLESVAADYASAKALLGKVTLKEAA